MITFFFGDPRDLLLDGEEAEEIFFNNPLSAGFMGVNSIAAAVERVGIDDAIFFIGFFLGDLGFDKDFFFGEDFLAAGFFLAADFLVFITAPKNYLTRK